ncbi:UNVERIFIED_ORG: hypothetical protein J2806_001941 [Kosakonia oryzae]|nr:hypothetical protein LG58_3036 [Kosakonia radicincitans YD4]MDP9566277.1 hypothetical protein [Kosakonia oryzae]
MVFSVDSVSLKPSVACIIPPLTIQQVFNVAFL